MAWEMADQTSLGQEFLFKIKVQVGITANIECQVEDYSLHESMKLIFAG
jgi:hypothetical protein